MTSYTSAATMRRSKSSSSSSSNGNTGIYARRLLTCALAAAALAAAGVAEAASTGVGDQTAVGSNAHTVTVAAPTAAAALAQQLQSVEPAAAESKKVAGKAAAMDGYVMTGSHLGDKGYNEDDTYGDKDSDSYGFGTHVSYGNGAGDGGMGAYHESTSYDDHGRSNPKYSAWHFEEKDGKPTKRYVYDSHNKKRKHDPLAVEAEASEYDSVEAYDDGDDGGTHDAEEAEPEYGNLYDAADAYDADAY